MFDPFTLSSSMTLKRLHKTPTNVVETLGDMLLLVLCLIQLLRPAYYNFSF